MRRGRLLTAVGVGSAAAVMLPAALGLFVAGKAVSTRTRRRYVIPLQGTTSVNETRCLVLTRLPITETPGHYGLWFDGGHVALGEVLDRSERTVTREILREDYGDVDAARRGAWSGHIYLEPAHLGLDQEDVLIDTELGDAPAWVVPSRGGEPSEGWAIHIHGLGSARGGVLRSVDAAADAGLTSLVVSYRNDGEAPDSRTQRSTLGEDESRDVEAAIELAVVRGAKRIVLVGWSMGASIALRLVAQSKHAHLIVGAALISPVLDWKATLKANCRSAGLPGLVGSLAYRWLRSSAGAKWIGLPHRLDLAPARQLEDGAGAGLRYFLSQGRLDQSVPIETSKAFVRRMERSTVLREFESKHTLEPNLSTAEWCSELVYWLKELLGS